MVSKVKHECIMLERLWEWETRFSILENNNKAMAEKLDKMEIKIDKIEDWIDDIKNMFSEMRLDFQTKRETTVLELHDRTKKYFASNTRFSIVEKIVFGAVWMVLIAFFTYIISLAIHK